MTGGLFAGVPYHQQADPLDRVFAYLDFRAALIEGDLAEAIIAQGLEHKVNAVSLALRTGGSAGGLHSCQGAG